MDAPQPKKQSVRILECTLTAHQWAPEQHIFKNTSQGIVNHRVICKQCGQYVVFDDPGPTPADPYNIKHPWDGGIVPGPYNRLEGRMPQYWHEAAVIKSLMAQIQLFTTLRPGPQFNDLMDANQHLNYLRTTLDHFNRNAMGLHSIVPEITACWSKHD